MLSISSTNPSLLVGNIQHGIEASSILNFDIIEEQAEDPYLHSFFNNSILYFNGEKGLLLAVPQQLIPVLLENYHQKALAHVGRDKMFHHLKDRFHWQGIQPVKNGMLQPISYPFVEYEAEEVARKFYFEIITRHGCPSKVLTARNAETDDTEGIYDYKIKLLTRLRTSYENIEQQRERRINYYKEQYDKYKTCLLFTCYCYWEINMN
ncbi:hypothetical protein BpHYR1_015810 [Brachionus plicatilis]|uniref:Integrase zinc-binding domain-containing protein n=1 Tax=Brachionus plicatilis TaxID=10195 RepID=A0A3M7QVK9_BRAPC|nr:hypothetical protein BpHYR1_015810 [Brachionus plicatilis]